MNLEGEILKQTTNTYRTLDILMNLILMRYEFFLTVILHQAIQSQTDCLSFPLSLENPNIWRIYAGILRQSEINEDTPFFKVEEIIVHSQYKYAHIGYDIALMRLAEPMNFTGMQHIAEEL